MIKNLSSDRLYFIDAIRAWAILMMLQGHFVAALLSDSYRNMDNQLYVVWNYFRGITAPVFFTVSGFIFTLLLIRNFDQGWLNPRVKKGIKRGLQLIAIGYILQIRFFRLIKGEINDSYNIVHVLQCLGLSVILIVLLYLCFYKTKKEVLAIFLCLITVLLFVFKSRYVQWNYSFLPEFIANYFVKANGSVFTIVPWFGYTSFGGFLSVFFLNYTTKSNFYRNTILITVFLLGCILIINSYGMIKNLYVITGFNFFNEALQDSYLFEHLGVVLLIFAFFMLFGKYCNRQIILRIGQKTLPIYILHSMVLYGSISGFGLSRFFYHSLSFVPVFIGAICFVVLISGTILIFYKKSPKSIEM